MKNKNQKENWEIAKFDKNDCLDLRKKVWKVQILKKGLRIWIKKDEK